MLGYWLHTLGKAQESAVRLPRRQFVRQGKHCRPSPTRQDRTPVDCAKRRTCRARKAARYQWRITRLAVLFELLLKTIFAYSGPWPYFGVSCSREESQTLARNRCLQQTVC